MFKFVIPLPKMLAVLEYVLLVIERRYRAVSVTMYLCYHPDSVMVSPGYLTRSDRRLAASWTGFRYEEKHFLRQVVRVVECQLHCEPSCRFH